ncbi:hypothetical protein, partial [Aeromonas caviae]
SLAPSTQIQFMNNQSKKCLSEQHCPVREPFSCHGRCLFSGHARFDIRQSAIYTGEDPLLAHQRHHGVDGRGKITPDR